MDRDIFFAVDIGNTRIKCGRFSLAQCAQDLPQPEDVAAFRPDEEGVENLRAFIGNLPEKADSVRWWVASVNRPATTEFLEALRLLRPRERVFLLTSAEIPLRIDLPHPDRVGIDRLAAAVAADTLRRPHHPAIVVDVGTAITVDLVSDLGAFLGGAIACGPGISARALHEFTDLLPQIDVGWRSPPPPFGKATPDAMAAGVFWGMVGTVRELATQQARLFPTEPDIFVTGGGAKLLADALGRNARYVEHLTLSGVALSVCNYLGKLGQTAL